MSKIIEIIYADSGGGHRSVARAIDGVLGVAGADCSVRLVNATEISRTLFESFSRQYVFLVRHAAWLYRLLYVLTDNFIVTRLMEFLLGMFFGKAMRAYLAKTDADLLISCHLLVNLLMGCLPRRARYVNFVVDPFSPHADSFSIAADLCIVASDAAKRRALEQGLAPHKVCVAGHPVAAEAAPDKRSTLKGLGLADSLLTVLITGGGEGVGKLRDVAIGLAESRLPIQIIVVCGHNQKLYTDLSRRKFDLPVCVLPFTSEMPALLRAADVLVSKAGPSTLFEAFQAALPIVLFDALLGQEAGNVAYVSESGAGVFCQTPAAVVDAVGRLTQNAALRQQMSACSLALAAPAAAVDVARACLSLIS